MPDDDQQRLRNLVLANELGVALVPVTEDGNEDDHDDGDTIRISLGRWSIKG